MSETINNIICNSIQIITLFVFMKILFKSLGKGLTAKDIIGFIILNILINLIYNSNYSGINTLIFFIYIVSGLFVMYKKSISTSFISAGLFILILSIADIITCSIFVNFVTVEQLRNDYFIYSNLCVGILTILIIEIPKLQNIFEKVLKISQKKKNLETILFLILFLFAITILLHIMSQNYELSQNFLLCVINGIIFLSLSIIFFNEKYEKERLIDKYDQLFEYVTTFEMWMDTESINVHESKNQLATLRGMVKNNKKAVEYIDNIIKENVRVESKNIRKLKYIPKGGIKGLLYYKITSAESNGIEVLIDVSKDVCSYLSLLDTEENKLLCRILGVFFDNAIEASKESNKKIISCEIYISHNKLNIVISNTYSGVIDLSKIAKRGYSTKGENRGNGLYLITKLYNSNKTIEFKREIINDFYVQKVIIDKEKDY